MSIQPIPPTTGPTTAGQLAARATQNDQILANAIGRGTQLTTESLDSILAPGRYWVRTNAEATPEKGYPVAAFGTMQVFAQHLDTASLTQVYYPNQYWAPGFYVRSRYNGAWGMWKHYLDADQMLNRVNRGTQLTTEHLDAIITPGRYWVRTNAEATAAKGYPFAAYGTLVVSSDSTNDANVTQVYYPSQRWASGFAVRSRYNSAWQPWQFFDTRATNDTRYAPASVAQAVDGMAGRIETSSGLKTAPLALTTGQSNWDAPAARSVRVPVKFNAPITRFRVHIRNWNPRLGHVNTGAVSFTGLWLADTSGSGTITGTPTQLRGAFTTPADGSEWVSAWFDAPIGDNVDRLLCFGYTSPATPSPAFSLVGGSYQAASAAAAVSTSTTHTRSQNTPFHIWLEAETFADTPVLAAVGDSLTAGTGADLPVHESWLAVWARANGALPMIVAHHGDSMQGFLTVNPPKVTLFAGQSRADAVVFGLGSNDIGGSRTLAQMQADYAALKPIVEANIGPIRYATTVPPRNGWDGTVEAERVAWNTWVTTRPEIRRPLDTAAAVSSNGDTLLPQYDSGDGTHLNTAGYAAQAGIIPATVTSRPVRRLTDTGPTDITAAASNVSGGSLTFQHKNGWNILSFVNLAPTGTGTVNLFGNNSPTLRPWAPGVPGVNAGEATEALTLGSAGADYRRVSLNYTGGMSLYGITAGDVLNGTLMWPMNRPTP